MPEPEGEAEQEASQEEALRTPDLLSRISVNPAVCGAAAMEPFQANILGECDVWATVDQIGRMTEAIKAGDVSHLEAMLVGQAVALQGIFTSLARRAHSQTQQRNLEAFLGLAFKAQAQSRATIQALTELKFPRQVAFVKQANIAHGNQQVNNGLEAGSESVHAHQHQEAQTRPNKLLEPSDGKWMDAGAQSKAGGDDSRMEALDAVHGPENRRRKIKGSTQ
jgi:hypothetical protein